MRYRFARWFMFILLLSGVCSYFIYAPNADQKASLNGIPNTSDAPPSTGGTTNLGFMESNESTLVQYPSIGLQTNVSQVFNPNTWNATQLNLTVSNIKDAENSSKSYQGIVTSPKRFQINHYDFNSLYRPQELAIKIRFTQNVILYDVNFGIGIASSTEKDAILNMVRNATIEIRSDNLGVPLQNSFLAKNQLKNAILINNQTQTSAIGQTMETIVQNAPVGNSLFYAYSPIFKSSFIVSLNGNTDYWFVINATHREYIDNAISLNIPFYDDGNDDVVVMNRSYDAGSFTTVSTIDITDLYDPFINFTYQILDTQSPIDRNFQLNSTVFDTNGQASLSMNTNTTFTYNITSNLSTTFDCAMMARLAKNFTYSLSGSSYTIDTNTNVVTATKTIPLVQPYASQNTTIARWINCTIPSGWTLQSVSVGSIDQIIGSVASISGIGGSSAIILTLTKSGVISAITCNQTSVRRGMSYEVTAYGSTGLGDYLTLQQYDPASTITDSESAQPLNTAIVLSIGNDAILGTHSVYATFDDGIGGIGYNLTTITVFDYVDVMVNLTDSLGRPMVTEVWLNGTNVQTTNASGLANWTNIYAPQTLNVSWNQQGIMKWQLIALNDAKNITIQSNTAWIYTVQQQFSVTNKTGGALPCNLSINNVKYATGADGKVTIALAEGQYAVNVILSNGTTIKTVTVNVVRDGAPITITTNYVMPIATDPTPTDPDSDDPDNDDTLFGLPTSLAYTAIGMVVLVPLLGVAYKKTQRKSLR